MLSAGCSHGAIAARSRTLFCAGAALHAQPHPRHLLCRIDSLSMGTRTRGHLHARRDPAATGAVRWSRRAQPTPPSGIDFGLSREDGC
uniref:Uncharacterized protein n=1 Tax=Setaria italica TaxID=4555 RepID=K3YNY5_SETIT